MYVIVNEGKELFLKADIQMHNLEECAPKKTYVKYLAAVKPPPVTTACNSALECLRPSCLTADAELCFTDASITICKELPGLCIAASHLRG